ncbi:MAG: YfiR family protein [Fibrobacteria bacterium]|nr:YfiR family protein [Fibrobacteria bacterium]
MHSRCRYLFSPERGLCHKLSVIAISFLLVFITFSFADKHISLEDKTKAVFMYHFTKFIEWPGLDSLDTFTIGVIGKTEMVIPLKEIAGKKKVGNKPIRIRKFSALSDSLCCQMLFIAGSEKHKLQKYIKKLSGKPVLTIGDSPGFASTGTDMNFTLVNGKIKFEINSTQLDKTGLKVSSQLLKLGIFIKEGSND